MGGVGSRPTGVEGHLPAQATQERGRLGGGHDGRAALSLDAMGGFPPLHSSKRGSAVRRPIQADRPLHKRGIGASASLDRGPKRSGAREHAVALGEVPESKPE